MMLHTQAITSMHKLIIGGQLLFIVLVFAFVGLFSPQLQYPQDGEVLQKHDIEFGFINAHAILVADNDRFDEARIINISELNNSNILFEPGTYYWKALGITSSGVRSFIVPTHIGLELNETHNTITNVGDTKTRVTQESALGIEGLVILDVDAEYGIDPEKQVNHRGEQHE